MYLVKYGKPLKIRDATRLLMMAFYVYIFGHWYDAWNFPSSQCLNVDTITAVVATLSLKLVRWLHIRTWNYSLEIYRTCQTELLYLRQSFRNRTLSYYRDTDTTKLAYCAGGQNISLYQAKLKRIFCIKRCQWQKARSIGHITWHPKYQYDCIVICERISCHQCWNNRV